MNHLITIFYPFLSYLCWVTVIFFFTARNHTHTNLLYCILCLPYIILSGISNFTTKGHGWGKRYTQKKRNSETTHCGSSTILTNRHIIQCEMHSHFRKEWNETNFSDLGNTSNTSLWVSTRSFKWWNLLFQYFGYLSTFQFYAVMEIHLRMHLGLFDYWAFYDVSNDFFS